MAHFKISASLFVLLSLTGCKSTPEVVPEPPKVFSLSPACLDYALQDEHESEVLGFRPVYFELNSDKPYSSLENNMACIVTFLANNPEKAIDIQGYTDDKGTIKYNEALAKRRAEGLVEHLVLLGASPSQLQSSAHIIENKNVKLSNSERSKIRRVNFEVISKS
ncbi:OmpA family protein [Shewanella sp. OMA3-2]|uniref:OmpA family protein n=1 Tax=Shewanella sp. OMA3-2 TaxID=2908650 RepID=UPI001F3D1DDF|nr:OmpA family protein [Shewanella sp. OMA3-2]UJF20477.1 OmpA family protein [Shewanella sp. OMA3-2]